MSALLPSLLDWLQLYGYPVLWLTVFIAAVGLPLPTSFVLLASGAFAALGDFNIFLLGIIAVTAATAGDNVGYFIGRRWGSRLLLWLQKPRRHNLVSPRTLVRAQAYFQRRGGLAIFFTRFLFSALGGVTNLLSGSELYPYRRFLPVDFAGEAVGATISLTLGYIFGASWDAVGSIMGAISLLAFALLVVIVLVGYLIKLLRQSRATREAQEREATEVGTFFERKDVVSRKSSRGDLPP